MIANLKTIIRCGTPVIAVGAVLYAALLIHAFVAGRSQAMGFDAVWHLVIWTIAPPIWFLVEWWAYNGTAPSAGFKYSQEAAGKVWAAVLTVLLYFYPHGPFENLYHILSRIERAPQTQDSPK